MTARWIENVHQQLAAIQPNADDDAVARKFLADHYRTNEPVVLELPPWAALNWTLPALAERVGPATQVQVQSDRLADPQYEFNSHKHRAMMPFGAFLEQMNWRGNDLYMTAQNAGMNAAALAPLWADVGPLPSFLTPEPERGFFWLGCNTVTPLHHDETNNYLCQVMGTKLIRIFPPSERDKLDPSVGVHSRLDWVSDDIIHGRGIRNWFDIRLYQGQALFLPIGWWHCVRSVGLACTIVYTNFRWPAFFGRVDEATA